MAGTQESVLKTKIGSYKTAKDEYEAAKTAPTSANAQRRLTAATTARNNAWRPVQTAYDSYCESMRSAGHTPRSLDDFLSGERTSR
jgi:hypothetical protein